MWTFFRDKISCPLNGGVPWLEVSQRRISTDHCRRRLRETVRSYWNRPGESDRGIHFSCRHCPSWRTFFTSREAFMHCLFWFQGTSCDLSGGERYVVSWWELNVVVKFLVVSAHFCPKNKRRWNTWGFFSLIRPLATGFSWKTANRKPDHARDHRFFGPFCSLQFTFERQEELPAVSDLRQGFFCD